MCMNNSSFLTITYKNKDILSLTTIGLEPLFLSSYFSHLLNKYLRRAHDVSKFIDTRLISFI